MLFRYKRVLLYIYIMIYIFGGVGGFRLVCKDIKYGGYIIYILF